MTRSATYHMRVMSQEELQSVLDWAALEGWNPGLHDAASFYAADPQGFWLGTLDHQPITSISAVKYGQHFGFVGLYIVKPEYRGQGYGLSLWNAALDSLGSRTLGLDGVVAQQENYKKSGFQLAHRNIRFAGVSRPPRTAVFEGIVELARVPFAALETHDRAFFPEAREAFLRAWITQPDSHALGVWEQQ